MLKGLAKAQALKEFRGLRVALTDGSLKGLDKARGLKRFRELRVLLGGDGSTANADTAINPVYQSVLDGAPVTRELILQVKAEGEKDLSHPQLRPVVQVLWQKCSEAA